MSKGTEKWVNARAALGHANAKRFEKRVVEQEMPGEESQEHYEEKERTFRKSAQETAAEKIELQNHKEIEKDYPFKSVTDPITRRQLKANQDVALAEQQFKNASAHVTERIRREFDAVKAGSGMTSFSTGSKRDIQDGKGKFFLISTIGMRRLAKHYENGAKKYASRNWEKGQPLSQYLDSCFRHLIKTIDGLTDEDHAAAVSWNIFAFMHTLDMINAGLLPAELNDMKEYWEGMKQYFAWVDEQEKGTRNVENQ